MMQYLLLSKNKPTLKLETNESLYFMSGKRVTLYMYIY